MNVCEKSVFDEKSSEFAKAPSGGFQREVFPILPDKLRAEIIRISAVRKPSFLSPEEMLLRRNAPVCLKIGGQRILLSFRPSAKEIERVLLLACRGSLYAFRDCLASGYLPMPSGIRVGVAGYARCDGGCLIGVNEPESLLFRIPTVESEVGEELYRAFCKNKKGGMLIFSPPGAGKTTALRSLAKRIGQAGIRLVIADDRGEFPEICFSESSVSILRGYSKGEAIAVAVRTLSPEVLLVDEIGNEKEADALSAASGVGVPLLASAHAGSYRELQNRLLLSPLLHSGAFSLFAEICCEQGKRGVRFYARDGGGILPEKEDGDCHF